MGLLYVLINALLYLVLLRWYWKKHKSYDTGFLLIAVWAIVAVSCAFYYSINPKVWKLTLWPFIYLFAVFLLFARMYVLKRKENLSVDEIVSIPNKRMDILCYIYIICAIGNFLLVGLDVSSMSLSGVEQNAVDSYAEAHEEVDKPVYSNQLERFIILYHWYFRTFAVIAAFIYLSQKRKSFGYIMLLSVVFPIFAEALSKASRGTIIELLTLILSCYLVFRSRIPKQIRKEVVRVSIATGAVIMLFILAISLGRFADSDEGVGGSFLSYLGHSMLTFDYGVCDSINGMFYGARTFKTTLSMLGVSIPVLNADFLLGTHFGSGFTTFIGMLCLDFGFIGTIIVGIVFPVFVKLICKPNRSVTVASLFFYLFFLNRLIVGVFANPSGIDFVYYFHFVVYLFLMLFLHEKRRYVIKK